MTAPKNAYPPVEAFELGQQLKDPAGILSRGSRDTTPSPTQLVQDTVKDAKKVLDDRLDALAGIKGLKQDYSRLKGEQQYLETLIDPKNPVATYENILTTATKTKGKGLERLSKIDKETKGATDLKGLGEVLAGYEKFGSPAIGDISQAAINRLLIGGGLGGAAYTAGLASGMDFKDARLFGDYCWYRSFSLPF